MSNVSVSIPSPTPTIEGLMATAGALKLAMDTLQSNSVNGVVRVGDMATAVTNAVAGGNITPGTSSSILDDALRRFRAIFSIDVVSIRAELTNARQQAIKEFQAALETNGVSLVDLQDQVANNRAAVNTEAVVRSTEDSALAGQITTVSAVAGRQRIYVQPTAPAAPATTPFDAVWVDTANGNQFKTWNGTAWVASDDTRIAANVAAITAEQIARANADSALATDITNLTTVVNGNTAAITSEATARSTADAALTSQLNTLTTTVNGNTAAISAEVTARTTADTAITASITSLTATVNSNTSAISTETAARTSADSALSGQITTAQAQLDTATATSRLQMIAVASPQTGVAAEFSLNVRASTSNSFAQSGLRLRAMSDGSSEMLIQANKFVISSGTSTDGSGTDYTPFSITVNGLESLAVLNGSLLVSGTVTASKLSVSSLSSITANIGTITAGLLQATSGKLEIDLNNATITGYD